MLKIESTEVLGWEHAIRGMRNPMNSWDKSDSGHCQLDLLRDCKTCVHQGTNYPSCKSHYDVGRHDFDLMTRLRNAGTDHRKFMRMLTVYLDITAPLYWWKEFDTYKVGTVANSCSTMHKIADKEFTLEDFSHEHLCPLALVNLASTISVLNGYRKMYLNGGEDLTEEGVAAAVNETFTPDSTIYYQPKDKKIWWQMIQLLPTSYNQKRTVMLNYEVLANIYKSRRNHKLDEWHTLCDWIEELPYSELITGKTD